MKILCFIILLVNICGIATAVRELTSLGALFEPCAFDDHNLDACLRTNLQILFQEWKQGANGSNALLILDPLAIKRVKMQQKNGFNAVLTKMLVHGVSKGVVERATMNKQRLVLNATIAVPKLNFETAYTTNGNLIGLYVRDKGNSSLVAENVTISLLIALKVRPDGNFTAIDVKDFKASIVDIENFRINFVDDQNKLVERTEAILREEWHMLYEIVHPLMDMILQTALKDRFTKIFAALPANSFIQNVPITEGSK